MNFFYTTKEVTITAITLASSIAMGQVDPVVRTVTSAAGSPLPGLNTGELGMFLSGKDTFNELEAVANGLGPRYNSDSCGECHFAARNRRKQSSAQSSNWSRHSRRRA